MTTQRIVGRKNDGQTPGGGVVAGPRVTRGFRWRSGGDLVCAPLRCRKEQSYFVRCRPRPDAQVDVAEMCVHFQDAGEPAGRRRVMLNAAYGNPPTGDLYGWFETPAESTHFQLRFAASAAAGAFDHIGIFPISERAAVSHPAANIPPGAHRPPNHIRRVVLPASLESIAGDLAELELEIAAEPASRRALIERVRDSAWILDPEWVKRLRLGWGDLERLASLSWMIADLETVAGLLREDRGVKADVKRIRSDRDIPCAKVVYADVATRGFALHDVLPYATVDSDGRFGMRTMTGDRSWRRYADEFAFATLLSYAQSSNEKYPDVLSAARPIGGGELIATDLPWLLAGAHGPLVAPRLARHLLAMHLAGPLDERLQYWVPSREPNIVLREIAELPRHHPGLRAIRWSTGGDGVMHLGLTLESDAANGARRHLIVQTGRIDHRRGATSLPPEAMMCLMKHLAVETRESTEWARRHLAGMTLTWQFDSEADECFRHVYGSAECVTGGVATAPTVVCLIDEELNRVPDTMVDGAKKLSIGVRHGVLGDGSIDYQRELARLLYREIEACR